MLNWIDITFTYLPTTVVRPDNVSVDGKGGVTQATFNMFLELAQARVDDRLSDKRLEVPDWSSEDIGVVLRSVIAQLVAGYILRKIGTNEVLYKDYFANAFATLDEYIADMLERSDIVTAPLFVDDIDDDVDGYDFPTGR